MILHISARPSINDSGSSASTSPKALPSFKMAQYEDTFKSEEVTLIPSLGSHYAVEKLGSGRRVGIEEEACTSALENDA